MDGIFQQTQLPSVLVQKSTKTSLHKSENQQFETMILQILKKALNWKSQKLVHWTAAATSTSECSINLTILDVFTTGWQLWLEPFCFSVALQFEVLETLLKEKRARFGFQWSFVLHSLILLRICLECLMHCCEWTVCHLCPHLLLFSPSTFIKTLNWISAWPNFQKNGNFHCQMFLLQGLGKCQTFSAIIFLGSRTHFSSCSHFGLTQKKFAKTKLCYFVLWQPLCSNACVCEWVSKTLVWTIVVGGPPPSIIATILVRMVVLLLFANFVEQFPCWSTAQ